MGTRIVLDGGDVTGRVGHLDILGGLDAFIVARGRDDRNDVGEVGLRDVTGEDGRLTREEEKLAQKFLLFIREREGGRGFSGIEMRDEFFAKANLGLGGLVAGLGGLLLTVLALLDSREVGED